MKRRNFFALFLGSLVALFFPRKPKSGPVYIDGKWIDYHGPFETQEDFEAALSRGELICNRAFKLTRELDMRNLKSGGVYHSYFIFNLPTA